MMKTVTFLLLASVLLPFRSPGQMQPIRQGTGTLSMTAPELLMRYLQIPSESGQEREAGIFLRDVCAEAGLHIRQFGAENGNFNFVASLYPLSSGKPNLVFLNHIDVVPAGDSAHWQQPPYAGVLLDGEIWGRGAFDNKGIAIMQLDAISRFVDQSRRESLPFNISLLAVSCEETQCPGGARFIVEHHLDELNPWVVIGEGPPALDGVVSSDPERLVFGIAIGHKRAFWVKAELSIRSSSHGSVTPLEYANKAMVVALERMLTKRIKAEYTPENLEILRNLGRLEGGVKGFFLKRPRLFRPLIIPQLRKQPEVFALFSNTITLTHISNPTSAHNTIPEKTTCLFDCRLLPHTDEQSFLKKLRKRLAHQGIDTEVVMETPRASCSSPSDPVYALLKTSILEYFGPQTAVVPLCLPNINDSGWFRAKGIPVFDAAPVRISRQHMYCVHGNDERIPISALREGAEVYALFLEKLIAAEQTGRALLSGD